MAQAHFLIVDGYPAASRAEFDRAGMPHAWLQYDRMLAAHLPGATFDRWFAADEPEPPAAPDRYSGVLWTGCNLTIYDRDDERVTRQFPYCQLAFERGVPQYGSCWGLQMAAVVAGGTVEPNPRGREMGLARNIHLTRAGRDHPFLAGKPMVYAGFISHVDEVTRLPAGAQLLASNDFTHVQAIAVEHGAGAFWAVQYHPEYTLADVARLIVAREPKLLPEGFFRSPDDLRAHVARLEALAAAPGRKDLRWQLGIDGDVLDPALRQREFANWLRELIQPRLARD